VIPKEAKKLIRGYDKTLEKQPWSNFISEKNKQLAGDDATDLLEKMLQYDKNLRIRPKDAMAHKYFDPIR
jgi:serine/threonine protein kinase